MRPPKPITFLALVLVLCQMTGCYSYRPPRLNPSSINPAGLRPGQRYRFIKRDWSTVNLIFVASDSLTIVAEEKRGREPQVLERAEILLIEERATSVPGAILVTTAVLVGLTVLALAGLEIDTRSGG